MTLLEPPDNHLAEAALGWAELGNMTEAWAEFGQISAANRKHPQALFVEWKLFAQERRWEEAAGVGEILVQAAPDDSGAWINRSFALHELKQTAKAYEMLYPALTLFPKESIIPYNLACYSCQLGNLAESKDWLKKAYESESAENERRKLVAMALEDRDLEPLWPEICKGM